jgi:hypothetical protein
MELSLPVIAVILVALASGFLNGMNDTYKSVATVIGSQVLSPHAAVVWKPWPVERPYCTKSKRPFSKAKKPF